jgi:hypothetical protein
MFTVEMRKMFNGLMNLVEWHQPFEIRIWGDHFEGDRWGSET